MQITRFFKNRQRLAQVIRCVGRHYGNPQSRGSRRHRGRANPLGKHAAG